MQNPVNSMIIDVHPLKQQPQQHPIPPPLPQTTNGNGHHLNGHHEPPIEVLEQELPIVYDGQIPLGDLLQRVTQAIYAELSEMAETLPNMSDDARKRTLADWVVKVKKQVVKLYAVAKWARDADAVQKCMNITSFLLTQNQQFEDAIRALRYAKESLDPARLRNHDLLTSLDVLTTGSYLRLPTCIKKGVIPPPALVDEDIRDILTEMEKTIQYRLRMTEIIPVEMTLHRIGGGRVYFTVPKLFETSVCLAGAQPSDGWFFVHVEFLFGIGGDLTGLQEFPRIPTGVIKRYITDEADARLAAHLPLPPGVEAPVKPPLPEGVVDAPLVRLYNFLQMMSLSYQLELLWYQAMRMRSLGWNEYLSVTMSPNRKSMQVKYWLRPPPQSLPGRPKTKDPTLGGIISISIVDARAPPQVGGPARSPKSRMLARLQTKAKLIGSRASDEVEGLRFEVKWEPTQGALGVFVDPQELVMTGQELAIDADCLDFDALLHRILNKHAKAILIAYQHRLQYGQYKAVFSRPGSVVLGNDVLRVHLCVDEVAVVSIDTRTGHINIRDIGDLAAAGRGPRFTAISQRLHEAPSLLPNALASLRYITILDLVEQKAKYLGLRSFRARNFLPEELVKLGNAVRARLFIQLANFPEHYLVVIITDTDLQYALITTKVITDAVSPHMIMEDIAWLDVRKIQPLPNANVEGVENVGGLDGNEAGRAGWKGEGVLGHLASGTQIVEDRFIAFGSQLSTRSLKDLYSYCCARVAYMNVERQFKLRNIPFTQVNPTPSTTPELAHIQSSLARSVPALCVQSEHILSGAPAAEAAMPNIRVVPLNWWSDKDAQVVTCVKLKYVQQPLGQRSTSGGGSPSSVIRPSKRIIYDTTEAVVSFLSENVNTCVDEFLEEWARVSKMVVIAREIAQMAKHEALRGVKLLSFDLQTVEFLYASDYTISLSCEDQLSMDGGKFILRFGRHHPNRPRRQTDLPPDPDDFNPHDDAEPFLRRILQHGRLASSLHRLVLLLRETLPIVAELEVIRRDCEKSGEYIDTFAKSANWYRLLYGDVRAALGVSDGKVGATALAKSQDSIWTSPSAGKHALDFRLMKDKKIAIIDGAYPIIGNSRRWAFGKSPSAAAGSTATPSTASTTASTSASAALGDSSVDPLAEPFAELALQPIPSLKEIINQAVNDALIQKKIQPGTFAVVDVGVICEPDVVYAIAKSIHDKVVEKIRVTG